MQQQGPPSPEENNYNLFSRLTYSYINSLLSKGKSSVLQSTDIFELPHFLQTLQLPFQWKSSPSYDACKNRGQQVWYLIHKYYGVQSHGVSIFFLFRSLLSLVIPLLLQQLILALQQAPWWHCAFWSLALFVCAQASTIVQHVYFFYVGRSWTQWQSSLQRAIFQKMLRLSPEAKQQFQTGEVVNLLSHDANKVGEFSNYMAWIHQFPLLVGASFFLVYRLFGWHTIVGLVVVLLCLPFSVLVGNRLAAVSQKKLKVQDERIKIMNELVQNIKSVKFFCWEKKFEELVMNSRNAEYMHLR